MQVAVAIASLMAVGSGKPTTAPGSFEEAASKAVMVADLRMLLAPFVEDCTKQKRELDRARCQGVHGALKARLPEGVFIMNAGGMPTVTVSDYDARIKGFRLAVAGCLACQKPIAVGDERRYLTLKAPDKKARSVAAGVELARTEIKLANVADVETWNQSVRPHLQAEFVFQPTDVPWTLGKRRGHAFKPLALRVVNRCTGEVIFSQPPSLEPAKNEDCAAPDPVTSESAAPEEKLAPAPSSNVINQALAAVRGELDGCLTQFPMPGSSALAFDVERNGIPQKVTVEGAAAGTALARCLIDVALRTRFPASQGRLRFKYPLPGRN